MGCLMTMIKNKDKRSPRRKWKLAFGCLLVSTTVSFVLFWAWDSFCEIPKALPTQEDFKQLVSSSDRSELEVFQRLYDGISGQIAWRGTADYVGPATLQYRCKPDSCKLIRAEIWIGVRDFKICRYERRIDSTIIEAYINGIDRGNPRLKLEFWRSGPVAKVDRERFFIDLISDVSAIKKYVLNSMGEGVWRIHRVLNMKLINFQDGWSVEVTPLASREIIYRAKVDRTEYPDDSGQ